MNTLLRDCTTSNAIFFQPQYIEIVKMIYFDFFTARHGNGIYFAKDFHFSAYNRFSPPDQDDTTSTKYVFMCKVMTGKFCKGNAGDNDPHIIDGVQMYDSAVNKMRGPRTFVIFHDAQAYPAYLRSFNEQEFYSRRRIYRRKV